MTCTFTRYLYEKTEVMHSLLFALLERRREEALFWTYELYFSGFEEDLEAWIRWIYYTFYSIQNTMFTEILEINLSRLRTLTVSVLRDCIFGTIVSNLAHRAYDVQQFTLDYLQLNIDTHLVSIMNHRVLIRFLPRDLLKYETVDICKGNPRYYLQEVSLYSIRKNESMFLRKYIASSHETTEYSAQDYLQNWLFHISETRIWRSILEKYPSFYINTTTQTATFTSDDDLELFHEQYGLEPDEQPVEIHLAHGIDVHNTGVFSAILPETFLQTYRVV